jgi:hypothetical protein
VQGLGTFDQNADISARRCTALAITMPHMSMRKLSHKDGLSRFKITLLAGYVQLRHLTIWSIKRVDPTSRRA